MQQARAFLRFVMREGFPYLRILFKLYAQKITEAVPQFLYSDGYHFFLWMIALDSNNLIARYRLGREAQLAGE